MLSDCAHCVEAGAVCRTDPARAKKLHGKCAVRGCCCAHVVPEPA